MPNSKKSKAEQEYEQIIKLLKEFIGMQGDSNKLQENYFKIMEKLHALLGKNRNLMIHTIDDAEKYLEVYTDLLETEKNLRKEKEKTVKIDQKEREAKEKFNKQFSKFSDYQKNYSTRSSEKANRTRENFGIASDIYEEISSQVFTAYNKKGIADRSHYKAMQKEILDKTNATLKEQGIDKTYEQLQKSAENLNKSSSALIEVGNLFKNILGSALKLIDDGINRQVQIYEDTFHNVSTRLNMSRDEYYTFQRNTQKQIMSAGLQYSVGVSENQTMLNNLAELGMSKEEAIAMALDNVVTQKIVPYLETNSLNFNLINSRVNGDFVKQIRGINAYNEEIAGNNYLTKELLNKMIDLVQPMSDESIQNLAKDTSNYTAAMNYLMSEAGGNLSYDQAMDVYNTIYKSQNYASQMMSGSTFEKMFQLGIQEGNIDLEDLSQLPLAVGNYFGSGNKLNFGPGYGGSAENNLVQSYIGESTGMSRSQWYAINKFFGAGNTEGSFNKMFTESTINLEDYTEGEFTRLIKNETTTATDMQKYLTENISTPVAIIKEQIGKFGEGILSGIDNIIKAIIGGALSNTLASAFGIKGVAGGLKSFLATGAGSGIAATLIGLAPIAAATIAGAIHSNKRSEEEASLFDEWAATNNHYDLAGNTAAENVLGNYTNPSRGAYSDGDIFTGTFAIFGDLLDSASKKLDNLKNNFTSNYSKINSNNWARLKNALDMNNLYGTSEGAEKRLAWMLLADYANGGTSLLTDIGSSHSELITFLANDLSPSVYDALKWSFDSNAPVDKSGRKITSVPDSYINKLKSEVGENFHRQGLATVPYDEYPAILHAGETVLTASTTAALSNLVSEYRESRNSNYRIDAAIQEQTAQLVAKIDEVINAIGSRSLGNVNTNSPSEKLRNSLRTLTSPLAFQG